VTVKPRDRDRYERTVGDVLLPDGRSLNHELVKAGLAWWYRKYAPDDEPLKQLERGARGAEHGLWADKNPIPPWKRLPMRTREWQAIPHRSKDLANLLPVLAPSERLTQDFRTGLQ